MRGGWLVDLTTRCPKPERCGTKGRARTDKRRSSRRGARKTVGKAGWVVIAHRSMCCCSFFWDLITCRPLLAMESAFPRLDPYLRMDGKLQDDGHTRHLLYALAHESELQIRYTLERGVYGDGWRSFDSHTLSLVRMAVWGNLRRRRAGA